MSWLPLDVHFFEDDKVIEAGEKAAVLYLAMCLKSKAIGSDGVLSARQIERLHLSGWKARLEQCVAVELLTPWGDDAWAITGWYHHNDPAEKVAQIRAADAARKRKPSDRIPDGTPHGIHPDSERREEGEEKKEEKYARPDGCEHGAARPGLCALCRTQAGSA